MRHSNGSQWLPSLSIWMSTFENNPVKSCLLLMLSRETENSLDQGHFSWYTKIRSGQWEMAGRDLS